MSISNNMIIVDVLKKWMSNFKGISSCEWVANNQMWIYPEDCNYVVYGHCIDTETDNCCEVFMADKNISIKFKDIAAITAFIDNPVILVR